MPTFRIGEWLLEAPAIYRVPKLDFLAPISPGSQPLIDFIGANLNSSRKLKVAKFYVSWRRWHCYEYDTVFILYARQNIVSADMFIKNIVSADITLQ